MDNVRRPSRALQVRLLQRLLNRRLIPPAALAEDGNFGANTHAAVLRFQRANRLDPDGIVGPQTWRALGVTIDIAHRVQLFGQPTGMTCWSAAATMLTGANMSYGPGEAALGATGGLEPSFENVQKFANAHGLTMHAPQSWTVPGLAGLMRQGPVWVAGWVPFGHAVVYGGIHGDGTPEGTLIIIYDPLPVGVGAVRGELYGDWMRHHPTATTYILQAR
jgi:hypothetical protein